MSTEYNPTFQAVIDYLESKDFSYTPYPEENRISLTMSGKNANYRFAARITHDGEYLQITSYYPFFVREEKLRPSSAELLTRANYNMPIGKFEMDMKDGEIRFHVTHILEGSVPPAQVIERIFMTSYFTIDRYFPALMQHLHAGYTPEDAVFHAELDTHADSVTDTVKESSKTPKSPTSHQAPETPGADTPSASPKPRAKRTTRKKPSGNHDGPQGDLPL